MTASKNTFPRRIQQPHGSAAFTPLQRTNNIWTLKPITRRAPEVFGSLLAALVCLATLDTNLLAADNQDTARDKERRLIAILQSDAPDAEKAVPCKQLAVYGSKDAVPALGALLPNPQLSSWARIALEAIPGPEASEALRDAMGKVNGKLLVGVINSVSVRRDLKAVPGLTKHLGDADPAVVSAAAEALGHIGGEDASKALTKALAKTEGAARPAVAYGCILCAENFLTASKQAEARRIYDSVRAAKLPKQRILEATRGAILARQPGGLPLLLEQLRSPDKAFLNLGLAVARELPGHEVTSALLSEMDHTSLDRQILLIHAVVERNSDPAVLPKVLEVARTGPKELRMTALNLLDRFDDLACVPVLLSAASESDPQLASGAKATLSRLEGNGVDADILARLPQATGKTRQVLIEVAGKRRINGALPAIVSSAEDADPAVRHAALETVGLMGDSAQAGELVRLLQKSPGTGDRSDLEQALVAICNRSGAGSLPHVSTLAKSQESGLRRIALHAFSAIGGSDALAGVKGAINDSDESVQDEAVSTLSNWPNNWPEDAGVAEPLLALAQSGKKTSHQVQGLRGYLQYLQEDKKLSNADKLARVNELLPAIKRPEEKRLTIAALSNFPTGGVLDPLITLADDSAVAEEASIALVKVAAAKDPKGASKELRRKALQTAAEKSKDVATRKKAEDALKQIN